MILGKFVACLVLRQLLWVGLMTKVTGVEPLIQHIGREYGRAAVD